MGFRFASAVVARDTAEKLARRHACSLRREASNDNRLLEPVA